MAGSGGGWIDRHLGFPEPQRSRIAPVFSFGMNGYRGVEAEAVVSGLRDEAGMGEAVEQGNGHLGVTEDR
jgi:hypothetical protein